MKASTLLLLSLPLFGATPECSSQHQDFLKQESAYRVVKKIDVASVEANLILNRYLKTAKQLLEQCPDSLTLDKQYILGRELRKFHFPSDKYRVNKGYEIRYKALTTREEITIYKNGTLRLVR